MTKIISVLFFSLTLFACRQNVQNQVNATPESEVYDECEKIFIDLLKSCPNFKLDEGETRPAHAELDHKEGQVYSFRIYVNNPPPSPKDDEVTNSTGTLGWIKWDAWNRTLEDVTIDPENPINLNYYAQKYADYVECMGYPSAAADETDKRILPVAENVGINVILTGGYREEKMEDYEPMLSEDWGELFADGNRNFYLQKAQIVLNTDTDECVGVPEVLVSTMREETAQKERSDDEDATAQTLLLIKGLPLSDTPLRNVKLDKNYVAAGKQTTFSFEGEKYTLRADGVDFSRQTDELMWDSVRNYKLFLFSETIKKEQLLVAMPEFHDTQVKILFVGDLDGDRHPDFVIDTSGDYESKTVVLFLSSKADKGKLVKCVGESSYVFDC